MSQYCPSCFNHTLKLNSRGVIHISINNLNRDNNRMLFNSGNETPEKIAGHIEEKFEEFFVWYSNFKNQEPIKKLNLDSSDFVCENKCRLPLEYKQSIIDILVPRTTVISLLKKLSEKYGMKVDFEAL